MGGWHGMTGVSWLGCDRAERGGLGRRSHRRSEAAVPVWITVVFANAPERNAVRLIAVRRLG
jgi:hypothetical protein